MIPIAATHASPLARTPGHASPALGDTVTASVCLQLTALLLAIPRPDTLALLISCSVDISSPVFWNAAVVLHVATMSLSLSLPSPWSPKSKSYVSLPAMSLSSPRCRTCLHEPFLQPGTRINARFGALSMYHVSYHRACCGSPTPGNTVSHTSRNSSLCCAAIFNWHDWHWATSASRAGRQGCQQCYLPCRLISRTLCTRTMPSQPASVS